MFDYLRLCVILCLINVWQNILISNFSYMSMDIVKQEAHSYFTTMVTQIKSLDGYDSDIPVCLYGDSSHDNSAMLYTELYQPNIRGTMTLDTYISMYSRYSFLRYYLGYLPRRVNAEELPQKTIEEIDKMPFYPADNSIKIIDDIIIVKISD